MIRKTEKDTFWIAYQTSDSYTLESVFFCNENVGYAVGWHCSVLKTTTSGVTVPAGEIPSVPNSALLYQNYPNPVFRRFAEATNIRFSISSLAHATLKIFDAYGKEVASLLDGDLAPGMYFRVWDTRTVPGGIYYALLTSGSATQSRAITVVK